MNGISTHVLDTSIGRPAARVPVVLEVKVGEGAWKELNRASTNADGRVADLLPAGTRLAAGLYRLTFGTGAYFKSRKAEAFYPQVAIVFQVADTKQHYHVPLLLSPFGFDRVFFEVVSAFATVGLSTGITADLPALAQLILIVLMFIGRLGPVLLGAALALTREKRMYELPKERPIIG